MAGPRRHWQAAQAAEDALQIGQLHRPPGVNALSRSASWRHGAARTRGSDAARPAEATKARVRSVKEDSGFLSLFKKIFGKVNPGSSKVNSVFLKVALRVFFELEVLSR